MSAERTSPSCSRTAAPPPRATSSSARALPRRRGGHPHAADRERRARAAGALIVREIGDGPERDAISPYGYPGSAWRSREHVRRSNRGEAQVGCPDSSTPPRSTSARPVWSAPSSATRWDAAAGRCRRAQRRADRRPGAAAQERSSDRNQINKNRRNGYELRLVPGPETSAAERAGFLAAYEQTMRRTGAAERYFFGAAYFDRILESERAWLALALAPGRRRSPPPRSPSRSDGFLHYYLSGSADSHLRDSPMKNVVAALVELAAELRPAAQPRRRHLPRRPARGIQARLRQPRAGLAHLRAGLRPRRLRAALSRPRRGRLLPAYRAGRRRG